MKAVEVNAPEELEPVPIHSYFTPKQLETLILQSLSEDAPWGDPLGALLDGEVEFKLIAKSSGVLAGLGLFIRVFKAIHPEAQFYKLQGIEDGYSFRPGELLLIGRVNWRSLSLGERTALNFLTLMSGVATRTHQIVSKLKYASLLDTRKTLPCLRKLMKYAFIVGGGSNHRWNLSEVIMFKDTHWKSDEIAKLVRVLRKRFPLKPIEIEVESLSQLQAVAELEPDIIMFDNMSPAEVKRGLELLKEIGYKGRIEVSGGITPANVEEYDIPGVHFISTSYPFTSPERVDLSVKLSEGRGVQ